MADLTPDLLLYRQSCIAPSSLSTYFTAWSNYQSFTSSAAISSLPLNQQVLSFYVTSLARTLAFKSIKVYLSGIQFYSNMCGFDSRISGMTQLFYILRGIRRVQGSRFTRPRRPAITINHLVTIIHFLTNSNKLSYHDKLMLHSAVCLAFFGLLRSSEYVCPTTTTFYPEASLLITDISINQSVAHIRIKSSKTDPFRVGCSIRIGTTGTVTCPVAALSRFMSVHAFTPGPLFRFQNGSFLTRNILAQIVQEALPHLRHVNTHSFRIGGASAAASAGIPDSTIQIMGRWSSNTFVQYIRMSDSSVHNISIQMAKIRNPNRYWDTQKLLSTKF